MKQRMLHRLSVLAGLGAAVVLLGTCSNGLDILGAVKTEVMAAERQVPRDR